MSSRRGIIFVCLLFFVRPRVSPAYEVYFATAFVSDHNGSEENATFLVQVTVDDELLLRFENGSPSTVGLGEDFVDNQRKLLNLVARGRPAHIIGSSFSCKVLGATFACSASVALDGSDLATVLADEDGLAILWNSENRSAEFPYNSTEFDVGQLNETLRLWTGKYDERLYVCGSSGFTVRTSVRGSESGTDLSCVVHSACEPSVVFFNVGDETYTPPCAQIGFDPDRLYSYGMSIPEKNVRNASCEIWIGLGHTKIWPFEPGRSSFGRIRRSIDANGSSEPTATPSAESGAVSRPSTIAPRTTDQSRTEICKRVGSILGLIASIVVIAVVFMICRNGLPCAEKKKRRRSGIAVSIAARRAAYLGGIVLE